MAMQVIVLNVEDSSKVRQRVDVFTMNMRPKLTSYFLYVFQSL